LADLVDGGRMSDMGDAAQRIGTADREAAVAALKAHHGQGRLDSQEYEDRALRAQQARTWAELDPLFHDLPEPRPSASATPAGTPIGPAGAPTDSPRSVEPVTAGTSTIGHGSLIPEPWAAWAVSLSPFVALILFFTTGEHWEWFLAIPIVGLIVYGPSNQHSGDHRDRDRRRDHH
jgi:hypothetical protein